MSISDSSKKPRQTKPVKRWSQWAETISLSHLPITYRLPLLIGALLLAVIAGNAAFRLPTPIVMAEGNFYV